MELKPCPFCGCSDLHAGHISSDRFAVLCNVCGSHGPEFVFPDHDEEGKSLEEWEKILTDNAINDWNLRS